MFFRKPVIFFVICFVVVKETEALKNGDEGVCSGKISTRKTKRVYYTRYANKWCGRKKCVVRATKSQPYVAMTNVMMCCSGWQYRSGSDDCAPRCSTGCAGGRCVAPERCACDAPSYLDPDTNNCVLPVCQPPCVNADCVANSTCSCHQHHQTFNATHCHNCQEGYTVSDSLECIHKCEGLCINSICTGPNMCTCLPGYQRKDNFICSPECDGCVNSECVAPGVCSCLQGFSPVNSTHCKPICDDCGRGDCISPGVCKCDEGYSLQNGTCKPHCNSCVNGHCSGPDECTCDEGYRKNATNRYECFKPCEWPCPGTCDIHGECFCEEETREMPTIQKSHACKKRKCYHTEHGGVITKKMKVCCKGYAFSEGKCIPLIPVCDPPCHNAQCTSKNNCTCNDLLVPLNSTHCGPKCTLGFYNDPSVPTLTCISQCKTPCVNATCTDFDTCSCNEGYEFAPDSKHRCEPECRTCENGICIAPDTCSCLPGYKDENDGKCRPICEKECSNGSCTAPNTCTCHSNYQLDSSNKFLCKAICVNKCVNASCVAPDTCVCDKGFEPAANEWTCRPKCDSCENGECVAPNLCKCNKGYAKNDRDNSDKCKPFCFNKCMNATCVAPDTCVCKKGFEKAGKEWICRPKCDSCANGECVAPNKCRCNKGYAKNDSDVCSPVCSSKCDYGYCAKPEVCKCNEGYILDEGLKQCTPICEDKCVNASCMSPDKCECWSGYVTRNTTKNTCKPLCRSCDNGECVAPEVCHCHEGFARINETCISIPVVNCAECEGRCNGSVCACDNGTACETTEQAGVASTPTLAGLQLTWMLGSGIGVLLVVMMVVVIHHIWRKRNAFEQKTAGSADNAYGSVVYAAPGTLMRRDTTLDQCEDDCPEDYIERL